MYNVEEMSVIELDMFAEIVSMSLADPDYKKELFNRIGELFESRED